VWTLCWEKGIAPCQGLLHAHAPVLALAQAVAKGAMQIIMSPVMTASKAVPSSVSICTETMMMDKSTVQKKTIASLPRLPLKEEKEKAWLHVGNRPSIAKLLCSTLYLCS
jgi:hypothetical protein